MIVLFTVVFTFTMSYVLHKIIFGRQDKDPDYKYFTPEDFGVSAESVPVNYGGVTLAANLYTVKPAEECDRVVIFQHGFGAGTSSYMTEIAHFANRGFAVLAADAYGCNNSAGKSAKGFYAGAEAVIAAYIAVKSDERLKNKRVVLVGHSWGAYSVLAASKRVGADGVVALSSFNSPVQCLGDFIKAIGPVGKIFAPSMQMWFAVINFFKFGAKGNTKAAKAIKKSGTKALLIHGEKDGTVRLKHGAAYLAKGENVEKLILPEKRHNPYNTVAAEQKLAELTGAHDFANGEEEKEYYASFDWQAATEEDAAVMEKIDAFIAEA